MKKLFALLLAAVTLVAQPDLTKPIGEVRLRDGRTLRNLEVIGYSNSSFMARWDGGRGTIAYQDLPADLRPHFEARRPRPKVETPAAPTAHRYRTAVDEISMAPKVTPPVLNMHYKPGRNRVISGQVFVTTRGGMNFKLGGLLVGIYPAAPFAEFFEWRLRDGSKPEKHLMDRADFYSKRGNHDMAVDLINATMLYQFEIWEALPAPVAAGVTDADGRFRIEHDVDGDFIVFARGKREVADDIEYYVWRVPSMDIPISGELMLHNANLK